MSKEESTKLICKKIGCTFDTTIYDNNTNVHNNNGTITRKLLERICNHLTINCNTLNKKEDCAKAICTSLKIPYNSDYIGNQGQIQASFVNDIEPRL